MGKKIDFENQKKIHNILNAINSIEDFGLTENNFKTQKKIRAVINSLPKEKDQRIVVLINALKIYGEGIFVKDMKEAEANKEIYNVLSEEFQRTTFDPEDYGTVYDSMSFKADALKNSKDFDNDWVSLLHEVVELSWDAAQKKDYRLLHNLSCSFDALSIAYILYAKREAA